MSAATSARASLHMPAQLILAGVLALVAHVCVMVNAKLALWADLAFRRRLRPAAALRALCEAERWTLADVWAATLARTPGDKPCVVCAESSRSFTFAAVERESNRIARWALTLGLAPAAQLAPRERVVVALMLDSSPEMVIFILGLAKAGATVALIDLDRRGARLVDALAAAGAAALIFGFRFEAAVTDSLAELARARVALHLFAPERGSECGEPAAGIVLAHAALAQAGVAPVRGIVERRGAALGPNSPAALLEAAALDDGVDAEGGVDGGPAVAFRTLTHGALLHLASAGCAACGLRSLDVLYAAVALERARGFALGVIGGVVVTGCSLVTRTALEPGAYWSDCAELGCTAILHDGDTLALLAARAREPAENAHAIRLAIGPAIGRPLVALLQHRFLVPEACALLCVPVGADRALVLAAAATAAASAAVGAVGRVGWLRSRGDACGFVIARHDGARSTAGAAAHSASEASRASQPYAPCARGDVGELLARAGSDAAVLGFRVARGVLGLGDAFVETGLIARHERFGGWVRIVGRVHDAAPGAPPPRVGPAEAARALAGADGVAQLSAFTVAFTGARDGARDGALGAARGDVDDDDRGSGQRQRVCVVALATVDGAPPDVRALASLLVHALPIGERAPLLLRHAQALALEPRTRALEPRTAALAAQGANPAAHGDAMWCWEEEALSLIHI